MAQPAYVRNGENHTRWLWRFDTPEKYQKSVKGYYRMISGIDLEIGKIRKLLAQKGLDKNTIIIFLGDNGYFLGERQFADKWLMYDKSLRVPMMIYDPRRPGHRVVEDEVLNIDIAPTIFGFAGLKPSKAGKGLIYQPTHKQNPQQNRGPNFSASIYGRWISSRRARGIGRKSGNIFATGRTRRMRNCMI